MRVITSLILLTACVAFAGVAFGVNPIGPMPESYIGYKIGPVVPYLSVNFFNAGGHFHWFEEGYNDAYDPPNYSDTITADWSGSVLMPTIGSKLVLGTTELKPFVRLAAGMPFLLSLNVDVVDSDYEDAQEDVDEIVADIKDGIRNPFILTGGAGVEYFFTDRFSVGGEFIYRYHTAGFYYEYYYEYSDGDWYRDEVDVQLNIGATSAGLWFNYYF